MSQFHADAAGDALVLNKWFALQASADLPNLLGRVKDLKKHKGDTLLRIRIRITDRIRIRIRIRIRLVVELD